MIVSITGGLDEFIADHSESPDSLMLALWSVGIHVEWQHRPCNCQQKCGYMLGEFSAGYYVADVWVWEIARWQWWGSSPATIAEAQLDALERLIRRLARSELAVAAPAIKL